VNAAAAMLAAALAAGAATVPRPRTPGAGAPEGRTAVEAAAAQERDAPAPEGLVLCYGADRREAGRACPTLERTALLRDHGRARSRA
jgi:acyl-CoA reductase-like NAD-dependent aldehyde dehydrogenase